MGSSGAAFAKGDSVRVKDGIMCPDQEGLCIAGWQGRVKSIEKMDDGSSQLAIDWDGITLKNLPADYIESSEEQGLGWAEMILSAEEVEGVPERDSKSATMAARLELEDRYFWLDMGEQGKRILAVIVGVGRGDETALFTAWETHLRKVLKFPFAAKVSEFQKHPPPREGDRAEVLEVLDTDEIVGVMVGMKWERKKIVFPLCDLTVLRKNDANYPPVEDYAVWFGNRQ